jgi:hypothetical protein
MRICILNFLVAMCVSGCVYFDEYEDTGSMGSAGVDWCQRLENTACEYCSFDTCEEIQYLTTYASSADCRATHEHYDEYGCP